MLAAEFHDDPPTWAFYVAREGDDIVAAAAMRPGEYVFGQRGPNDGLQKAADIGAGRFEIDGRPPSEWDVLDTYRALLFGVGRGNLGERLFVPVWETEEFTPETARDRVVAILSSDLSDAAEVTTFSWPSRAVTTGEVSPDVPARLLLLAAHEEQHQIDDARRAADEVERRRAAAMGEAGKEARAATDAAAAELVRRQDTDEFTTADLVAAVSAVAQVSYLEDWGAAILAALENLQKERPNRSAGDTMMGTLKRTATLRYQSITPFEGMLEAPREIIDVYQAHAGALNQLIASRDEVLSSVLKDFAARVIGRLDEGVLWGELARHGAVREQPTQPAYDDLDEYF